MARSAESPVGGSGEGITLATVPGRLHWQVPPARWSARDGKRLTIEARRQTDLFADPQGGELVLNAARLLGLLKGDFTLSAMLTVQFGATFDAGSLLIHEGDRSWAKLCLERSPQGEATVVSVVTRGASDDATAMAIDASSAWLRVARIGAAYAFHASTDGTTWQFVRHFALGTEATPQVGFSAQSPIGAGCTVTFEDILFEARRLTDLRNGE
jgi:uncharacterized protein